MRTLLFAIACLALPVAPALAGPISVGKAWVRPAPKGLPTSAAYFTIANTGPADVLESVSTPAARASVHMSMAHDGMMMMHSMAATPIPTKGGVTFKPGGMHVMLEALKAPLAPGAHVPLTLVFRKAGKVTVDAEVRAIAP